MRKLYDREISVGESQEAFVALNKKVPAVQAARLARRQKAPGSQGLGAQGTTGVQRRPDVNPQGSHIPLHNAFSMLSQDNIDLLGVTPVSSPVRPSTSAGVHVPPRGGRSSYAASVRTGRQGSPNFSTPPGFMRDQQAHSSTSCVTSDAYRAQLTNGDSVEEGVGVSQETCLTTLAAAFEDLRQICLRNTVYVDALNKMRPSLFRVASIIISALSI